MEDATGLKEKRIGQLEGQRRLFRNEIKGSLYMFEDDLNTQATDYHEIPGRDAPRFAICCGDASLCASYRID